MLRWIPRLLLLVYLALPIVVIFLIFSTVQQIQADVEPALATASSAINTAATTLDFELRSMGRNFQPLVNTVNALRAGLNAVASFVSGAINVMVDAVNGLTFNTLRIPRFQGITIPPLVDLAFINRIAGSIDTIGGQVAIVATTVTETVNERLQTLTIALVLLVAWMLLGVFLLGLTMFLTLWRDL
ncbi:MAG: hypothetical protein IPK19_41200 [Chloroflexi bacterium]|nr:hypothetical protein [Chloroflexota bacterium]